jgi:photosystem II stability/assembly factor-like uncharacterized protein
VLRVAVLAVVSLAGSGHFGELRVTHSALVKAQRVAPPPFPAGPARNIGDVVFLSARVGFLVSSTGQFDHEPARIQRSRDGGRTWHDVWRVRRGGLSWITFADTRHGFAGGNGFILRTSDGGTTWKRSPMKVPKSVQRFWLLEPHFVTPELGLAVTDPSSFGGPVFLRTTDGGVHWKNVRVLRWVRDVDFVNRQTGFALARRLYRTDDGGASWHAIGAPNVPYLAAADFLDAKKGFVAGGYEAMTERGPSQVVFATRDGGRTWQRRFLNACHGFSRCGDNPFARLRFIDNRHGWATTGLCKCCPSGPCVGAIYVTRDGGYSWRRRGTETQLTTVGARFAWARPGCDLECDLLWHTTNGGRSWRPIARPARINYSGVAARGSAVGLTSYDNVGFVSPDGGRTWRLGNLPAPPVRAELRARYYVDEACGGSVPFVEAARSIHLTSDDGRTWKALRPPFAAVSVALAPQLLAAVGVRDCTAVLAISRSGGRSWTISEIPRACEPAVAGGAEIWLWCERLLLHSSDGGRTWSRLRAPAVVLSVAPLGAGRAWIVAGDVGAGRLWRTEDGGKTWKEAWPGVPTRG